MIILGVMVLGLPILVEKRHEKKENLKKHFEELRKEAEDSIFSRNYSLSSDKSINMSWESLGMESKGALTLPFKRHFAQERREWEQLIASGRDHNKGVGDFEAELKKILEEETGLAVEFDPTRLYVHFLYSPCFGITGNR